MFSHHKIKFNSFKGFGEILVDTCFPEPWPLALVLSKDRQAGMKRISSLGSIAQLVSWRIKTKASPGRIPK